MREWAPNRNLKKFHWFLPSFLTKHQSVQCPRDHINPPTNTRTPWWCYRSGRQTSHPPANSSKCVVHGPWSIMIHPGWSEDRPLEPLLSLLNCVFVVPFPLERTEKLDDESFAFICVWMSRRFHDFRAVLGSTDRREQRVSRIEPVAPCL